MMPTELNNLIQAVCYWSPCDDGVVCIVCDPQHVAMPSSEAALQAIATHVIPYTAFAALHPDLPLKLQMFTEIMAEHRLTGPGWTALSGDILRAQVKDLCAPLCLHSETPRIGYFVGRVDSLSWPGGDAPARMTLLVYSKAWSASHSSHPGVNIVFDLRRKNVTVPTTSLDAVDPDWRERYVTAESLGLDDQARAAYVMEPVHPLTSAVLPDVTFD